MCAGSSSAVSFWQSTLSSVAFPRHLVSLGPNSPIYGENQTHNESQVSSFLLAGLCLRHITKAIQLFEYCVYSGSDEQECSFNESKEV